MAQHLSNEYFLFNVIHILSPLDLYNLRRTNKLLRKSIMFTHIKNSIFIKIKKRIKQNIAVQYEDFLEFLKKTQSFISGSFILQCILDENYGVTSDIDIYSTYDMSNYDNVFSKGDTVYGEYHRGGGVISVTEYKPNKAEGKEYPVVQTVEIMNLSPIEFVNQCGDFDVCKNAYYYDGIHHLYIYDLVGILRKIERLSDPSFCNNIIYRKNKYEKRGFIFKPAPIAKSIKSYNDRYPILVYTDKYFIFGDKVEEINDLNWNYMGMGIKQILGILPSDDPDHLICRDCDIENHTKNNFYSILCLFDEIYKELDYSHFYLTYKSVMANLLGSSVAEWIDEENNIPIDETKKEIFIILIKYEPCKLLNNFKQLEYL